MIQLILDVVSHANLFSHQFLWNDDSLYNTVVQSENFRNYDVRDEWSNGLQEMDCIKNNWESTALLIKCFT